MTLFTKQETKKVRTQEIDNYPKVYETKSFEEFNDVTYYLQND